MEEDLLPLFASLDFQRLQATDFEIASTFVPYSGAIGTVPGGSLHPYRPRPLCGLSVNDQDVEGPLSDARPSTSHRCRPARARTEHLRASLPQARTRPTAHSRRALLRSSIRRPEA